MLRPTDPIRGWTNDDIIKGRLGESEVRPDKERVLFRFKQADGWESTTYHSGILLVKELVAGRQRVPVLLPDQLLHLLVGQVDAVVEVAAPENVVVRVEQATLEGGDDAPKNDKCCPCPFWKLLAGVPTMGKLSLRVISL